MKTKAELAKAFYDAFIPRDDYDLNSAFAEMIEECCQSFSDHLEDDGNLSEWDWSFEFVFDDGSVLIFQYTSPDEDGVTECNCEVLK